MNFITSLFTRKGKRQGIVMLAEGIIKKEKQQEQRNQQVDAALDKLKADILAVRPSPGPAAPNPGATEEERHRKEEERKRKQKRSPIQQMQHDRRQESKYFRMNLEDWQVQQIVAKTDYRHRLELNDFVRLYDTVISNQVRDMYDLDRLDDQARRIVLAPCVDKKTFDKLVAKCWAISGDCPAKPGIHRGQWIASHLDKIVSKRIK